MIMINYIWFIMIFLGIIVGILTGNGEVFLNAIISSYGSTVTFIISLSWNYVLLVWSNEGS